MKRWAFILRDKVHEIIKSKTKPNWPQMPDGKIPVFVELIDDETEVGWDYCMENNIFTSPPIDLDNDQ